MLRNYSVHVNRHRASYQEVCYKLASILPSLSAINTLAKLLLARTVMPKEIGWIMTKKDSMVSSRSSSTTWMGTHSCVSPMSKVKVDVFKGKTSEGAADQKCNTITMFSLYGTVSILSGSDTYTELIENYSQCQ